MAMSLKGHSARVCEAARCMLQALGNTQMHWKQLHR